MNLRNLTLVCLLGVFSFMAVSAGAVAAEGAGVNDGLYYDTSHPGSGVDVRSIDADNVFVAVYVSSTPMYGSPTWFTAQGSSAGGTLDLLGTDAVLTEPGAQTLAVVGSLSLTPNGDGSIDAVIVVRDTSGFSPAYEPITVALHLVRLI
jgi:hypothetical protein